MGRERSRGLRKGTAVGRAGFGFVLKIKDM